MLKELEDEDYPRVCLVLEDPAPQTPVPVVEENLSYAASVAAHADRLGCQVQLVTGDGATASGQGEAHLDRILGCLALYEPPPSPRPSPAPVGTGRVIHVRLDAPRANDATGG